MTMTDAPSIPLQPWRGHFNGMRWDQGDHLLIAAPTKAGKTTMASKLAEKRSHVVMLVTKTHDDTIRDEFRGWDRIHKWPPSPWQNKVLLWPEAAKTLPDTLARQQEVFAHALDRIALGNHTGWSGWGLIVDEYHYLADYSFCGLHKQLAMMHHVGRSAGISMMDLTQRPAWIPKITYSSVTHAYVARTRDTDDLKRLSDLGGLDSKMVRNTVSGLPRRHDYLYLNPQGDSPPAIVNTRK